MIEVSLPRQLRWSMYLAGEHRRHRPSSSSSRLHALGYHPRLRYPGGGRWGADQFLAQDDLPDVRSTYAATAGWIWANL